MKDIAKRAHEDDVESQLSGYGRGEQLTNQLIQR